MLTTLALLEKPATFADLSAILAIGDGRIKDAIANTKEMFLVVNDVGNETTYTLEPLTREFILNVAPTLDLYGTIKARVNVFTKQFFAQNPLVARIEMRVDNIVKRSYRDLNSINEAWSIVTDKSHSPSVTEQPQFKALLGYVACQLRPPKLMEARSAFDYVLSTNYEPRIEHLKTWFFAERASGVGFDQCKKIADFVWDGRSYDREDKYEFLLLKAAMTYYRARERQADEPTFCASELMRAAVLNLTCYKYDVTENTIRVTKSEEYARNTAFALVQVCLANFPFAQTALYLHDLIKIPNVFFDPLEEPIAYLVERIKLGRYQRADLNRARAELNQCMGKLEPKGWLDQNALLRVHSLLKELTVQCEAAILVQ